MNLKDCRRIVHPDACYACKWAGYDVAIWPQNLEGALTWRIYAGVNEQHVQGLRSGFKSVAFCTEHAREVERAWIEVAMDEVWLDYIWNQWIERMEE